MSDSKPPSWRDVLLLVGASIAISVGCSWTIFLVSYDTQDKQHTEAREALSDRIKAINSRLNARWRDLDPPDKEPTN